MFTTFEIALAIGTASFLFVFIIMARFFNKSHKYNKKRK